MFFFLLKFHDFVIVSVFEWTTFSLRLDKLIWLNINCHHLECILFLIKLNEEVTEMAQRIKQTRPLVEEVAAHIRELIDKSALGSFT